jgi:uncharacterized protein YqeY
VTDWKSALKAKNPPLTTALSNIRAAMLNKAVELGVRGSGLDDTQSLAVLHKMAKQSEDSLSSLPQDSQLYQKESYELSIINTYLPKRISLDEVKDRVFSILKDSGVRDLGAGMKLCLPSLKNVADGKHVQICVKQFIDEVVHE